MATDKPARRSWNIRVPTTGGPVSYLNIYDTQEDVRIPEIVPTSDGTYTYSHTGRTYRWRRPDPDV